MLAVIDYQAGNQTSVARALAHLEIPCAVTADPDTIARCSGIIFPGVGSARQAMRQLRSSGMDVALREEICRGKPLLGICLGCQILLDSSEEGPTPTLGIVPGECVRFCQPLVQEDGSPAPVPHMGWNGLRRCRPDPLLEGIPARAEFYFVHSYYVRPAPELVVATTSYGLEFCSMYGRPGLWAVQFHPEKSGPPGLKLLANFYSWCQKKGEAAPGA